MKVEKNDNNFWWIMQPQRRTVKIMEYYPEYSRNFFLSFPRFLFSVFFKKTLGCSFQPPNPFFVPWTKNSYEYTIFLIGVEPEFGLNDEGWYPTYLPNTIGKRLCLNQFSSTLSYEELADSITDGFWNMAFSSNDHSKLSFYESWEKKTLENPLWIPTHEELQKGFNNWVTKIRYPTIPHSTIRIRKWLESGRSC